MTDYDGPPLTRRERKERERLLAEATGQTPAVDAPIPGAEPASGEPAATGAQEAATPEAMPEVPASTPEPIQASEPPRDTAPSRPEPSPTQAIDVSELIADARSGADEQAAGVPGSAERTVPDAGASGAGTADAASTGLGRFFGRRAQAAEEQQADERESIAEVLADLDGSRDEPARPATPMTRIEVDDLDPVDDAELDRLEIDEVVVADAPVSSRRIAESTPAQLEDHRAPAADDDEEATEAQAGPSRATGRMPVVVNVVEDTSRHHIADLREDTSAISASSVGTGTSTITANALVLPASGAHEPITVETADGVIVTGSIDLPDGFASSGRSRGTIDSDVDGVDDAGEVRSPETQPVRASRAVSSYANARVRIAPQRRTRNAWPVVIGVTGGVGIAAVGVTVAAFLLGWL